MCISFTINLTRYVSPPEACWKIFAFQMHARAPVVERLYFHLENKKFVYWKDTQEIGSVASKKIVKESMFTAWMGTPFKWRVVLPENDAIFC